MLHLGASLWDSQLRGRVEALQWSLAKDLLALGLTVIVEWGTWARSERDALRVEAREFSARVELIHLDVPIAELWRRINARGLENPAIQRADLDEWVGLFEAPDDAELALYDAS
jgi:predicted kinase